MADPLSTCAVHLAVVSSALSSFHWRCLVSRLEIGASLVHFTEGVKCQDSRSERARVISVKVSSVTTRDRSELGSFQWRCQVSRLEIIAISGGLRGSWRRRRAEHDGRARSLGLGTHCRRDGNINSKSPAAELTLSVIFIHEPSAALSAVSLKHHVQLYTVHK